MSEINVELEGEVSSDELGHEPGSVEIIIWNPEHTLSTTVQEIRLRPNAKLFEDVDE